MELFRYSIKGPSARTTKRGFVNLSKPDKTRFIPFKTFNILLCDMLYSIIDFGIRGCFLEIIPIFINNIAKPNGKLLPGRDTGKRNGATSTIHEINPPFSPISSKKSLNVIPSVGISKDILETVADALSLVDSLIIQPIFYYTMMIFENTTAHINNLNIFNKSSNLYYW